MDDNIKLSNISDVTDLPQNLIADHNKSVNECLKQLEDSSQKENYKSLYEGLFDLSDDLMCITFSNGHLLKVNKSFTKLLGYNENELIGVSVLKYIHPDDIEMTINAQHNVYKHKKIKYFENRWKKKNGEYIRLEWSSNKIFDGYLAIARIKNNTDLYLSKITHELRTPMNSIVGFTTLLLMDNNLNKKQKKYIKHIRSSSDQLLNIIDNILEISKLSTKGYTFVNINLLNFLKTHIKQFEPQLKEKNIKLTLEHSFLNNDILSDTETFKSIIDNLISNAIKFNKNNGEIIISSSINTNEITITIKDTGIGINKNFIKDLFTPFKRDNPHIKGTGLGLSIVKNTIELMKGKIEITSEKNVYTLVTIKLPICTSNNIEDTDKTILNNQPKKKKIKIVYVEDNELNILIVEQYLINIFNGHHTFLSRETAESGYDYIAENPPDILLLDYHLPDYDGDELYLKLQKLGLTQKIKIVCFISADAGIAKIDQIKKLGINNYILKPIRYENFKSVMEQIYNII